MRENLQEAQRIVSVTNEAIESLEMSMRREFRNLKDALVDLSSQLLVISHQIEEQRKGQAKG